MPRIPVSIATAQQLYDYAGITAAQAAAAMPSGTTLASFVASELARAAESIAAEINYDYTAGQFNAITFPGNDLPVKQLLFPPATVTKFSTWDPLALATTTYSAAILSLSTAPYAVYRNDNQLFDRGLTNHIEFTQAADPLYGGWPPDILEIQLEMVTLAYRNSGNQSLQIGRAEFNDQPGGRPMKYKDMLKDWKQRLRIYKRLAA